MASFARILGIAWITIAATGCAMFDKNLFVLPKETAESVHHIEMAFPHAVFMIDDTINPGIRVPCLKGRVYLMDSTSNGRSASGWLLAELFDITNHAPNSTVKPPRVAQWDFGPDILKQIESPDKIGLGYTVFLPLDDYKPSMKKALLRIVFVDARDPEGKQVREQNVTMNLRIAQDEPVVQMDNLRNVPAMMLPKR